MHRTALDCSGIEGIIFPQFFDYDVVASFFISKFKMFCTVYFLKQKTAQLITGDCSWSLLHGFKIWNKSCPFKPTCPCCSEPGLPSLFN